MIKHLQNDQFCGAASRSVRQFNHLSQKETFLCTGDKINQKSKKCTGDKNNEDISGHNTIWCTIDCSTVQGTLFVVFVFVYLFLCVFVCLYLCICVFVWCPAVADHQSG